MQTIGKSALATFMDGVEKSTTASNAQIRQDAGHRVRTYFELARKVAELQFLNGQYALLFRGQDTDFRNAQKRSTLKPKIFRTVNGQNPGEQVLLNRYQVLLEAERLLASHFLEKGRTRIARQRITRWSIIQHYEIADTPLLDVTHSLRVAASFACLKPSAEAYLYVLGVPHLGGALTASADAGIQIARLASMCPPSAVRPHIQEGYLLGEYPELSGYDQKSLYKPHEVDFGLRLIAKFRFDPAEFWARSPGFPKLSPKVLSPSVKDDPFLSTAELCAQITDQIRSQL